MSKKILKKFFSWLYSPVWERMKRYRFVAYHEREMQKFESLSDGTAHVFYLGITNHRNLGDFAQHFCIRKWIGEHYPERQLVMFESDSIVDPCFTERFFSSLRSVWNPDDIIIFQSGYCTQDLGGSHPQMHYLVCERMPEARILMMPQTVYFRHEENKRYCAENHSKAKNMLFLARDFVSYEMAREMFHGIRVKAFPDIVTTLIGTRSFNHPRKGVCLCTRNDGEKFYSEREIRGLAEKLRASGAPVLMKDTQSKASVKELRAHLEQHIWEEIESYSHYEVTITDRYHGTIFSLCAGTPVVIIKTTDHKVTTGADWFKGVYDEYVYVAEDLEHAQRLAEEIIRSPRSHNLQPYFKTNYYDRLKAMFEGTEL